MHLVKEFCAVVCVLMAFGKGTSFAAESTVPLPSKENFHLFLLAGQSNMAGRGQVSDLDRVIHPRILMLTKEGRWAPAVDPIHFDKSVAGVGLGKSFAKALADEDEDIVIGLVPAACGGSPIASWKPGGYHSQTKSHPYDDAIIRAKSAMKDGVLKGILWHQGESDAKPGLAEIYPEELRSLVSRFRGELDVSDLPFIIGQLGQFPERPWSEAKKQVDFGHRSVAMGDDRVEFVRSDELTSRKDLVHFDADSLREFGKKYAQSYRKLNFYRNGVGKSFGQGEAEIPMMDDACAIDGRLNEGVWSRAARLGPFRLNRDGSEASESTEVRLWYDREALYLGWICEDTDILATFRERDSKFWEEEVVEFFVTDDNLSEYYEIQWNPLNAVFDAIIENQLDANGLSRKINGDWSYTAGNMTHAVVVEGSVGDSKDVDSRWVVEVRLPFSDLGFSPPKKGDQWRIGFYRFNRGHQKQVEQQSWAPTLLPSFHQPSKFGRLRFGGEL